MSLSLYAHPFSSYCWKVQIALYENGTPFTYRRIDDAIAYAEMVSLWPLRKFPVLKDGDTTVIESSVIIEHLMLLHPGPQRLIPDNAQAALKTRFMDRFFDNYVMTPMQKIVSDHVRAEGEHDFKGVADAKALLDTAYEWLEKQLASSEWVAGSDFTLADCAAAPALFYADWAYPISDLYPVVSAYRARLLARPSVVRAVDEARPYRHLFPMGAPDRD